jgi:capsid protein
MTIPFMSKHLRDSAAPNIIDRLIGYFDPQRGETRVAARARMSLWGGMVGGGHVGGSRDRHATRNWRPWARSANEDTLQDLRDLRTRSRDLVRNTPIATGAIATVVTNVVRDGLVVKPSIDREVLGLTEQQAIDWQKAPSANLRSGRGIRILPTA